MNILKKKTRALLKLQFNPHWWPARDKQRLTAPHNRARPSQEAWHFRRASRIALVPVWPQRGGMEPVLTEQGPSYPPPHSLAATQTRKALISGIYQHSIYEQHK